MDLFVGVYGKKSNAKLMASRSVGDLKNFIAVTNSTWEVDKLTLEALGVKYTTTSYYKHVFTMIDKGRSDFTLISFSNRPDKGHTVNGITLIPVPGIKIQFKKDLFLTNHFVINKQADNAIKLYELLQKGLVEMKRSGEIDEIYQNTGTIVEDNREVICCK